MSGTKTIPPSVDKQVYNTPDMRATEKAKVSSMELNAESVPSSMWDRQQVSFVSE